MALEGFPVVVVCPVQWGEMDAYQHVNNGVYFRWFETGRSAYFDEAGLWSAEGPRGVAPILHSVSCRYRAPLTYPDEVEIGVRVASRGADRFEVEHAIYSRRLARVVAEGRGVVVSYDYDEGAKAPLPAAWLAAIERIEGRSFSSL
jgi:acyl-CoA thioester hydrolase